MKPVPGYEGLYWVTADGRLIAARRPGSRGGEIGGYRNDDGYLCAVLTRNYKRLYTGIHHLVALAFLGDPGDGFEVNHKNGVRDDNRVGNLEWVTHAQNQQPDRALNLVATRPRGEANGSSRYSEDQIREVFRLRAAGLTHAAIKGRTGISQQHISTVLRGQKWAHLGLAQ